MLPSGKHFACHGPQGRGWGGIRDEMASGRDGMAQAGGR